MAAIRKAWIRDELLVAFNLYCRIPFGRLKIEGRKIALPERFRPDEGALGYHREKVFWG